VTTPIAINATINDEAMARFIILLGSILSFLAGLWGLCSILLHCDSIPSGKSEMD
jgi:hypothetical protein